MRSLLLATLVPLYRYNEGKKNIYNWRNKYSQVGGEWQCSVVVRLSVQPTPDLEVGQAITGITINPYCLSQTEPVATALGWPLSQETIRMGLLKVRHCQSLVLNQSSNLNLLDQTQSSVQGSASHKEVQT